MDAVFFDIDDTLYDQAQPFAYAVHRVLGPIEGADDNALFMASRKHSGEVFAAFANGERPTREIYVRRMERTLAEFGVSIDRATAEKIQYVYSLSSDRAMSLSADMLACLALCAAACPLGVITNGTGPRQRGKLRILEADRFFEPKNVFISDELGMAKPHPEIFRYACDHMGAALERSLFIGDSFENDVVGANNVGLPVIWFNRRKRPLPANEAAPRWTVESDAELLALLKTIL